MVLTAAMAASVALGAAADPAGAGTIDQQHTGFAHVQFETFGGARLVAQTVTAGITGLLDRVDIRVAKGLDDTADVIVEIRDVTADGAPGDTVWASEVVPSSSVPDGLNGFPETAVMLSPGVPVTAEQKFAIVFSSTGVASDSSLLLVGQGYSRGEFLALLVPGEPWVRMGQDLDALNFKTYVTPATTLVANPSILKVAGLKPYLTLSARLTNTTTGAPIAGRPITFTAAGKNVCTAYTNSNGEAACGGLAGTLQSVLSLGYTASFYGDSTYLNSYGQAGLIG